MIRVIKFCDECRMRFEGAIWRSGVLELFDLDFCSPACLRTRELRQKETSNA